MTLTDSEVLAILADDNELSDSSDEELSSEKDSQPKDLYSPEHFTQYF